MRRAGAIALCASLGACTTAGPRTRVDANGWATTKTYSCDWKHRSNYLVRNQVPNSPVLPYTRTYPPSALYGVPLVLDLVFSPIAYFFDRQCWVTDTQTSFVGTPASRRKEREEQAKAESAAAREKAADEAKAAAEAARIAAQYPPLADSPRTVASRPDDFALIVGIQDYRSVPAAAYAAGDAKTAKTYLEALGVPPGNVVLLTGEHASRSDITKYLEEWLPGVVKPDSRVYFYYSGHGAPDPASGEAYLVPWDGDPQFLKSTALPVSRLYADLGKLPSRDAVVMLDSCFSGAGGRSIIASGARPLVNVRDDATAPPRTAVFAAAGGDQISGAFDLRRHGLFTYFLLRGLSGEADADRDGHVTAAELEAYLASRVGEAARRFSNRDQTPRLLGDAALKLY
jgi:hypothetical protein